MKLLSNPKIRGGAVTAILAIVAVLVWRRWVNPRVPASFQV